MMESSQDRKQLRAYQRRLSHSTRCMYPLMAHVLLFALAMTSTAQAAFPDIDATTLTASGRGVRILAGATNGDNQGFVTRRLGDVNGDGIDDIAVSSTIASPLGRSAAGSISVIYGHSGAFADVDPLTFNFGAGGFQIYGGVAGDNAGYALAGAGDVNGDGVRDLIVGAYLSDPGGITDAGTAYVIFGRNSSYPFPAVLDLLTFVSGNAGFKVNGASTSAAIGRVVNGGGDVNGDGYDDVIIGTYSITYSGRGNAGAAYVIFGHSRATAFTDINAATFTAGTVGFRIYGAVANGYLGGSVGTKGDINSDGYDDVVVSAPYATASGRANAGIEYVILGHSTGTGFTDIDLLSFTSGATGFRILGEIAGGNLGVNAAYSAGDINNDGYDDLVLGAHEAAYSGRTYSGIAYVIFGRRSLPTADVDLLTMTYGTLGFRIFGAANNDLGLSVSGAGDVNRDGIQDLLIGAHLVSAGGRTSNGAAYVIFGHSNKTTFQNIDTASVLGDLGYKIYGAVSTSYLGSCVGAAGDINADGVDDYFALARESTVAVYVVFGSYPLPSVAPTIQPSPQPTRLPSCAPTKQPTRQPTSQPSGQPSRHPSRQPSSRPSSQPISLPSSQPSCQPTRRPSGQPSAQPSAQPLVHPSSQPSGQPSGEPSSLPSSQPSDQPTTRPSDQPSGEPSSQPLEHPSSQPSGQPSAQPSLHPTTQPTDQPSSQPTAQPSFPPTTQPISHPSDQPTRRPSGQPSAQPLAHPSSQPSEQPSGQPSMHPTIQPTDQPSSQPSAQPSFPPTTQPSSHPSDQPSGQPSSQPSSRPTVNVVHFNRILSSPSYQVHNGFGFAVTTVNGSVHTWGEAATGGDSSSVRHLLTGNVTRVVGTRFSFAALKDDGSVVPWGEADAVREHGGNPLSSYSLASLVANEGAYAGIDSATGGVRAFGSKYVGGDLLDGARCRGCVQALSSGVTSIIASAGSFAAMKADGTVFAWGSPHTGADASAEFLSRIAGAKLVVATRTAFAVLLHSGSVMAWGDRYEGGDTSAVADQLTSGVLHIVAAKSVFVAFKTDSSIVAWGYGPWGGDSSAVAAELSANVTLVAHTFLAFAALMSDGRVTTWGDGNCGGDSSAAQTQLVDVVSIHGNSKAFAALTSTGKAVVWGKAAYGGQIPSSKMSALSSGVVSIYHNDRAFAALKTGGTVVVWGQAGHGGSPGAAVEALLVSGVHTICANDVAFLVVRTDGSVVGWGHPVSIPKDGIVYNSSSFMQPVVCA